MVVVGCLLVCGVQVWKMYWIEDVFCYLWIDYEFEDKAFRYLVTWSLIAFLASTKFDFISYCSFMWTEELKLAVIQDDLLSDGEIPFSSILPLLGFCDSMIHRHKWDYFVRTGFKLAKVHHSPCKKLVDHHTCQQLPDHQKCYKTYKCAALDLGAASCKSRNLHKLV